VWRLLCPCQEIIDLEVNEVMETVVLTADAGQPGPVPG